MVTDDLQRGCRAWMQLWRDDPTLTEVVFFRAPPGAKIMEGFTPFRCWTERTGAVETRWPCCGDCGGVWNPPHEGVGMQMPYGVDACGCEVYFPYYAGAPPAPYDGQRRCGSEEAWAGGGRHGVDAELMVDARGKPACCLFCGIESEGGQAQGGEARAGALCGAGGAGGQAQGGEAYAGPGPSEAAQGGQGQGGEAEAPVLNNIDEVPAGVIDGVNPTFSLSRLPGSDHVDLFINGLRQVRGAGADFTLFGLTITFAAGSVPRAGDVLIASFWYS